MTAAGAGTQCCIAGGGPAGLMLGYLLARAGVRVVVLEKHDDFLRDFRGDTIHPSTLTVLDDLGLLDEFLQLPHQEVTELTGEIYGQLVTIADFRHVPAARQVLVLVPQWDFLAFIARKAQAYSGFALRMGTRATAVIEEDGRIVGVRVQQKDRSSEIRADLVVGADGRHATLRESAGLATVDTGAPIDVLWFHLPRDAARHPARTGGVIQPGAMLVTLNRDSYWQCAFVIPKGSLEPLQAQGIAAFRARVAHTAPFLADVVDALQGWDDVKLLSVQVNHMPQWCREGLLCIGDAAHAMSPVGGVGINLAIQDAVAAANALAGPLARGQDVDPLLKRVEERRMFPTRAVQGAQKLAQDRIIGRLLKSRAPIRKAPLIVRLFDRYPLLRRIPGRLIGLGIRRERVRSPVGSPRP